MSFPMTDAHGEAFHRFTTACQDDARIQAAFLGGCHGAGTADAYSDLDLYVIIADESYDDFFADETASCAASANPSSAKTSTGSAST